VAHDPNKIPCFDGYPWPYNARKAQNSAHNSPSLHRQDATVGQENDEANKQKADPQHNEPQKA